MENSELKKHIEFTEKQLIVYRYHNHPDVLKMEALHSFLLALQPQQNTNQNPPEKQQEFETKTTEKESQSHLFDTSEFTKQKSMYEWGL